MSCLVLCDDLLFFSRISATAETLGFSARAAKTMDALKAFARNEPPTCVIIDLANPTLKLDCLMNDIREVCPHMPRVVAFGAHVDAGLLRAARAAGCDPVLPRSKFTSDLPTQLREWLQPIS
ncbi:MAG: hypothetical protein KatS3mg105_1794 [Gemmatales bacterium]|nr:MAG: hypothetical protein KatS3mg105_1794 [Gemmatales bacterium]